MKKLMIAAACVTLASCSKTEAPPEPVETTPAAVAAEEGAAPGTYEVTMADGTMSTTAIMADGSYVTTDPDGAQMRGAYARKDGMDCFDPAGDAPEECWTDGEPGADGSFTSTSADGTVTVTIKPMTPAESMPAEPIAAE